MHIVRAEEITVIHTHVYTVRIYHADSLEIYKCIFKLI